MLHSPKPLPPSLPDIPAAWSLCLYAGLGAIAALATLGGYVIVGWSA